MLKMHFFNQMPRIGFRRDWPYYHGDCTYIEFPDGRNMLVDASTRFSGEYLTGLLLDMGVKKINWFVVSHLHQDHTAGFEPLIQKIDVDEIIYSGYGLKNTDANLVPITEAQARGIPLRTVRAGQSMDIGGVHIDFLHPLPDAPEEPQATPSMDGVLLNQYSLVFRLKYGRFSALMTGDIHFQAEEELAARADLKSTLLKLPHHGNITSTGDTLVDAAAPQLAVLMSTGCEWDVQRRFSMRCIPVYATFADGAITAATDGQTLTVACDKGSREFRL